MELRIVLSFVLMGFMTTEQTQLMQVTIFTDGGCDPNPGSGGYGVILAHGGRKKELSGGFRNTTNNRMEVFAAIAGLQALKFPCKVKLRSDSRYLVDAMTKGWVQRWRKNGWRRNKTEKASNIDLWEKLLELCSEHKVEFQWVKGHAGIDANERCDRLAASAMKRADLPVDEGYEQYSDNK